VVLRGALVLEVLDLDLAGEEVFAHGDDVRLLAEDYFG
jgi:hypothetical protein